MPPCYLLSQSGFDLHSAMSLIGVRYTTRTVVRESVEAADRRNQNEIANRMFVEARTVADRQRGRRGITETDHWKRAQTAPSQIF
jgi:hypothetical protein